MEEGLCLFRRIVQHVVIIVNTSRMNSPSSRFLRFSLRQVELVNIGAADIVDGNHKLILGLIWSIIVHWQVRLMLLSPSPHPYPLLLFPRLAVCSSSSSLCRQEGKKRKDKKLSLMERKCTLVPQCFQLPRNDSSRSS